MIAGSLLTALVLLLAGGVLYLGLRHRSGSGGVAWREELSGFIRERPRGARVYVCAGAQAPARWREVKTLEGGELTFDLGEPAPLNAVTAFVVTYSSGEILATSRPQPRDLPAGAYFSRPTHEGVGDTLSQADVAETSPCVRISFGPVRDSGGRGRVYETKVTNHCSHPVRVTHFGAYALRDGVWTLNTIVGGFFTAEQFREWYGPPQDGWLPPGASAADRENYGADALWVFFFETPDGKHGRAVGRAPT